MTTTLLSALLILLALASILALTLFISLRHRSRALAHAAAASSAAEAGTSTPFPPLTTPPSPTTRPAQSRWWQRILSPAVKSRSVGRTNTELSSSSESRYLCPAPGSMYQLPVTEVKVKIPRHPSLKDKRKAPPLVAARSAYRLSSANVNGGYRKAGMSLSAPQTEHESHTQSKFKESLRERDEATSPTHTSVSWPLPLEAQRDPNQTLQLLQRRNVHHPQVVTADGNFEDIYLEKDTHEVEPGGAWQSIARRVASSEREYNSGPMVEKPLPEPWPEVQEEGRGRHGSFDFERAGLEVERDVHESGAGGKGWRLSWWGRSEAVS